jgi:hypothetical protein
MSEHVHEATDSTGVLGWVLNNRLKAIGYTWLAGVGGSLVSLCVWEVAAPNAGCCPADLVLLSATTMTRYDSEL